MSIVAEAVAVATPSGSNRLKLIFDTIRARGLDAVAYLGGAFDRRDDAIIADANHDRDIASVLRVAAIGAQEAEIRGCGCAHRFDRVIVLGRSAQAWDAREDACYGAAFNSVDRGRATIRSITSKADQIVSGLGRSRG